MDNAHNKVQVYARIRPYTYDYEIDFEKNKEIKDGVKCIIQLRNIQKESEGKSNSKDDDNYTKSKLPNTIRLKNVQENTFQ